MMLSLFGCSSSGEWEEYLVYEEVVSSNSDGTSSQVSSSDGSSDFSGAGDNNEVVSNTDNEVGVTVSSEESKSPEDKDGSDSTIIPLPSTEEMIKDLNGLNVLALGDSLFRGTSPEPIGEQVWINRLAIQCDWNITNLGWGGMTVSYTDANRLNDTESMYDKLFNTNDYVYGTKNSSFYNYGDTDKSAEEVDVIFLEGGSNDYNAKNNVPLGGVDSDTKDTFLGAWNLIAQKLMNDYPNAAIIFLTTWELELNTRSDKVTSLAYSTSIKTLYESNYSFKKKVTLIDMGNPDVSGAYMEDGDWRNKYAFDRYHLNNEGMKIVGDNMLPHIWRALKETKVI